MTESTLLRTTIVCALVVVAAGCAFKGSAEDTPPAAVERSAHEIITDPFAPPKEKFDAFIELGYATEEDGREREANDSFYQQHRDKIDALVEEGYAVAVANGEMFTDASYVKAIEKASSAHPDHQFTVWTKGHLVVRP